MDMLYAVADDGMTEEDCPDCGGRLRWVPGKWLGTRFLGCSKWPKCGWTSYRAKALHGRVVDDAGRPLPVAAAAVFDELMGAE